MGLGKNLIYCRQIQRLWRKLEKYFTFKCKVCFKTVPLTKRPKIDRNQSCGHTGSICRACISKHVTAKLKDGVSEVNCPGSWKCKALMDPLSLKSIIPPDVFDLWCDLLCIASLEFYERCHCPNENCPGMWVLNNQCTGKVVGKIECPYCSNSICFECMAIWEGGHRCGTEENSDALFRRLVEDKKWARCPHCNFYVERHGGCNLMMCRCKKQFCYKCKNKQSCWYCNGN